MIDWIQFELNPRFEVHGIERASDFFVRKFLTWIIGHPEFNLGALGLRGLSQRKLALFRSSLEVLRSALDPVRQTTFALDPPWEVAGRRVATVNRKLGISINCRVQKAVVLSEN